jgi:predicted dehydrogenase
MRLEALTATELVEVAALADPNGATLEAARSLAPSARAFSTLDELLECDLDAIVIATPSGLHAEHCLQAFERGLAVFCQKPLARSASEVERVVTAARSHDRLLGVDFCYRGSKALVALRDAVKSGSIGRVYAAELTFHNAYGPDKAWARDRERAGGGCLLDLGVHLLDAVYWTLGAVGPVRSAHAAMFAHGRPLKAATEVEDFALAELVLGDAPALSLACSWQASFGDHAAIRIALFGSEGGALFSNVNGSFFDFRCERFRGTAREILYEGGDDWSGRTIVEFAARLAESPRFREDEQLLPVAGALDALYARRDSAVTL